MLDNLLSLVLDRRVLDAVADSVWDWKQRFSPGDPPEFLAIYESASATIANDPTNAPAHFQRGVICQSKGWHDHALADFVAVVRQQPEHARAWLLMAEVLSSLGEPDKARLIRQHALDPSLR